MTEGEKKKVSDREIDGQKSDKRAKKEKNRKQWMKKTWERKRKKELVKYAFSLKEVEYK